MKIIDLPSPNFDTRDGQPVDMLVMHYTGMKTAQEALDRLRDGNREHRVSSHYVIDEDGTIYRLVPEDKRAWHAGKSYWRGHTNINQRSIGIEMVNPGHEFGYRPFPEAQMQSVIWLCQDILKRHKIPARNVVAHSDIAPERKEDPGELFDWKRLAESRLGVWSNPNKRKHNIFDILKLPFLFLPFSELIPGKFNQSEKIASGKLASAAEIQQQLTKYGYDCTDMPKTILAFQRHFRSKLLNGKWDRQCELILKNLLASGF